MIRQKIDVHNIDALNPIHYKEVGLYTKIDHLQNGNFDDIEFRREIIKNVSNLIYSHFLDDLIHFAKEDEDFNIDKRYYIENRNLDEFHQMTIDLAKRIKRSMVPFMKSLYHFPYMDFSISQEYSWAYDCQVVNVQATLHKATLED